MPKQSTSLEKLFEKIAHEFESHHIPYMVIGGQAVLLYGEPRLTRDIDVTLGVSTEEIIRIKDIVSEMGLEILVKEVEQFVQETMVLPTLHKPSGMRVDLIFSFSPYEKEALQRTRKVKIGTAELRFASLEDILIHKIISGRPRDIEDIKSILLKNSNFDIQYMEKWLRQFSQALDIDFLNFFNSILKSVNRQ